MAQKCLSVSFVSVAFLVLIPILALAQTPFAPPPQVPYGLSVSTESAKHAAAAALARQGIETVQFWNRGDPESFRRESHAQFLRRHVLEIPIHQDVTPETAEYMAQQILKLGVGLAA